jgi:Ca2+-binding RTX toxin-like protein
MAVFTATAATNVDALIGAGDLTLASLLAATYSNETSSGFTATTADGLSFEISGSGFTYSPPLPLGGIAQELTALQGSATLWSISGLSVDVVAAVLDPSLLSPSVVLAGNDIINGSRFADNLKGFEGNDLIRGKGGNDTIDGGPGNDRLVGGRGRDHFVFDSALDRHTNVDKIFDFHPAQQDKIVLSDTIFAGLGPHGTLKLGHFHNDHAGPSAKPQIIYTQANGFLFYDANGGHPGGMTHFATLTTHPVIHNTDFLVVA